MCAQKIRGLYGLFRQVNCGIDLRSSQRATLSMVAFCREGSAITNIDPMENSTRLGLSPVAHLA